MKFRSDLVKLLCTSVYGVAGLLLVALFALFTVVAVDFGANTNGLQSRSLEWLLGSDRPGGTVFPSPFSQNVAGDGAEKRESRPAVAELLDPEEIAPNTILAGSGEGDEQARIPTAVEDSVSLDSGEVPSRWDYEVCLLVRVGRGVQSNKPVLPYSELYKLFNAVKSLGSKRNSWVGTDLPTIVCLMVRDALGPDVKCSNFGRGRVHTTKKCKHVVVGETKRYAPQPSLDELQKLNVHYEAMETVDMDAEDPARTPPAMAEWEWRPTVVTTFSSNHVEVGLLLLRSLGRVAALQTEFNVSVVVWTMNEFPPVALRALQCVVAELRTRFNVPAEVRAFDFDAWPQWMRINQTLGYNGGRGEYAWKAVMIHTVLLETGFVYWADAGDRFKSVDGLTHTLRSVKRKGFASRLSSGQVKQWCHPRQLDYFHANVPGIRDRPNCDASGIGFTLLKYRELARPWFECSTTRQCIAPEGSSRKNHRQDQAALTVLAALSGNACEGVHQDIHKNLDSKPASYSLGVDATTCYHDPLHIVWH